MVAQSAGCQRVPAASGGCDIGGSRCWGKCAKKKSLVCFLTKSSAGRKKADKTPGNSPSRQHRLRNTEPPPPTITANDATRPTARIKTRRRHCSLNTYSPDRCPRHRHRLFRPSTETASFHTLIESLVLKGADAKRLTTL